MGAKEITCEASSCFHEFSPLCLLFSLTFFLVLCLCKRCKRLERGLAAWRLSASLAPLNFSSSTLAHVVPFRISSLARCYTYVQCSSRLVLVSGAHVYDVPEGWQRQLLRCTRRLPERGVQGRPSQRRFGLNSRR